jgi:anthranilate phosphoribosyltransferase
MSISIPNTKSQAFKVMEDMLQGNYSTDELVAFLKYFQKHPANTQLLQSFLEAIKFSAAYTISTKDFDTPLIDIAGTGGDGKNTINISTLTGIFCAATGLVKVAKYGNRAASGMCGSMDVLEANDIQIDVSFKEIEQNLHDKNFSPLFARSVYPGAKNVAEARSKVDGPTIFNLLFPLARPIIGDPKFVFGVADKQLLDMISEVYIAERKTRCLLVHGLDGTDEVSVSGTGETEYVIIDNAQSISGRFSCQDIFGISPIKLSELQIGNKREAIRLFIEVCNPHFQSDKFQSIRKSVYANSAVALFIGLDSGNTEIKNAGKYLSVLEEKFRSGKVIELLKKLQANNKG